MLKFHLITFKMTIIKKATISAGEDVWEKETFMYC
jgi:hypothetical protein